MKNGRGNSLILAVPALLLAACGGGGGGVTPMGSAGTGGGSAVTADCTMDPGSTPDDLSTFEDGTGSVLPNEMRNGGWYSYVDTATTCSVMPVPHTTATAAEIPGGRCASLFALNFKGTGCTDWGAGVGTDLAAPPATDGGAATGPKVAYDMTPYKGVSFWSRSDMGSSMRMKMPMTDETKTTDGGDCVESATTKCSDDFGANIALTKNWIKHTVMFSTLTQEKWGKAFTWNPAHVTSIQFQVPKGAAFDVWIDDVAFIK
jgi:hypothetical protein